MADIDRRRNILIPQPLGYRCAQRAGQGRGKAGHFENGNAVGTLREKGHRRPLLPRGRLKRLRQGLARLDHNQRGEDQKAMHPTIDSKKASAKNWNR